MPEMHEIFTAERIEYFTVQCTFLPVWGSVARPATSKSRVATHFPIILARLLQVP